MFTESCILSKHNPISLISVVSLLGPKGESGRTVGSGFVVGRHHIFFLRVLSLAFKLLPTTEFDVGQLPL